MSEIAAISAVIGSLKSAADIAKIIKESKVSLNDAETKFKVAELISSLADAKMEMADVQALLIEKDQYIQKLKDEIAIKKSVVYYKPCYWIESEIDDSRDGPFCQKCYDGDLKLIRLQGSTKDGWHCRQCKVSYQEEGYVPRKTKRRQNQSFQIGAPITRI